MHQEINLSGDNAADLSQYREQIIKLSEELLSLEIEFSAVLSEGARWVKRITWLIQSKRVAVVYQHWRVGQ